MSIDNRKTPRFSDFARAKINDLTQIPGFLEDVSRTGCKVRFPHVFEVDSDREYTLTILPALRSGLGEFDLVVKPEWVRPSGNEIEIGFTILHCPGVRQLMKYVDKLAILHDQLVREA